MKQQQIIEAVKLNKLVHGGQCLAKSPDGRKLFVWGGLPGETVDVRVIKRKYDYAEAIVENVVVAAPQRIAPKEPDVYLSSSPWQIMNYQLENQSKQDILIETFNRERVEGIVWHAFRATEKQYAYRNKIEVGFWGDEDGLNYASYIRGSHGKQIISSNALASEAITSIMPSFLASLASFCAANSLRAGDFKTVVFRSSEAGEVVAALFTKVKKDFSEFKKPSVLKGLAIYYSNPKSPASIATEKLYTMGDITLTDNVLGKNITYDVASFFQVNLPIFNEAAAIIEAEVGEKRCIDFYSGVGTIGIPVGASVLVDSDQANIARAKENASSGVEVVGTTSEKALDYIDSTHILIVDPPRAGLHKDVVRRVLEVLPPKIIYLSCNPSTQARDVRLLQEKYAVTYAQGYNFFPRTPHIESLIVMTLLSDSTYA